MVSLYRNDSSLVTSDCHPTSLAFFMFASPTTLPELSADWPARAWPCWSARSALVGLCLITPPKKSKSSCEISADFFNKERSNVICASFSGLSASRVAASTLDRTTVMPYPFVEGPKKFEPAEGSGNGKHGEAKKNDHPRHGNSSPGCTPGANVLLLVAIFG